MGRREGGRGTILFFPSHCMNLSFFSFELVTLNPSFL